MTTMFLVLSLFFPRLTLLCYWLFGDMPPNSTPFIADVLGAVFVPNLLVAYWAWESKVHFMWVVVHVVFALTRPRGESEAVKSRTPRQGPAYMRGISRDSVQVR
jgi:hypothetical protein